MIKVVRRSVGTSRRRVGFSLIETLVSLALIVLLAGVVLPSVLGLMSEQPVERARQAFASAADAARAEAQRSGEMVVVSCRVGADGALELVSKRGKHDERANIRDSAETDLMSRAAPMAEGFAPVPLAVLPANCQVRQANSSEIVASETGGASGADTSMQSDAPEVSWAFLPDGRVVKMDRGTNWVVAFADGEAALGVNTLSGQITVGEKRQLASAKVNDGTSKPVDDGFAAPKVEDGKFERRPMMESRQTPRNGSDRSRE
jgi:type II secretory pathway pseudopilin PulG